MSFLYTSNTKLPSKLSLSQISDNRKGDIQLLLQITTSKFISMYQPTKALFYVYWNVYLTNHMTPPKPSPPIMFGDKTSTSCIIRKIILIMAGKTLLKALQQNNTTGAMCVLLVKLWFRSIPGSNLLQSLTLIDLKQQ